jgi:F-type H+-transporting ATPase subunit a
MKDTPEGAQNFWEWLVESLHDFLESIIGRDLVLKTFWFFATIFIFILFTNWFGLLPGIGTIGWGTPNAQGGLTHISEPLLRGVNADLNMTFAMAAIFFLCWIVWALQANGPGGFIMHLFGPKGDTTGLLKVLMVAVFILVGLLEVVSILFRPISLSFRLYGTSTRAKPCSSRWPRLFRRFRGCYPSPFISWNCSSGLCRHLFSCFSPQSLHCSSARTKKVKDPPISIKASNHFRRSDRASQRSRRSNHKKTS